MYAARIAPPKLTVLSVLTTGRTICEAAGVASDIELVVADENSIALQDTWGVAKLRIVARTKIALIGPILPLYDKPPLFEVGAHPIAQFPL